MGCCRTQITIDEIRNKKTTVTTDLTTGYSTVKDEPLTAPKATK